MLKYYIDFFTVMIITVLLLVVSKLLFENTFAKRIESFKSDIYYTLSEEERTKLLNCLLCIHNLFETHNIWYVMAFGTLLGAVRHHGLIPWDDDGDLLVKHSDKNKIINILPEFEKYGYVTEVNWKLIKIYPVKEKNKEIFVDLFLIDENDTKIVRCETNKSENICVYPNKEIKENDWWTKWFYFNKNLIKSRKQFNFDGVYLYGPTNPDKILKYWYGNDCLTNCKSHYLLNHETYVEPKKLDCGKLPEPQL